MLKYLQNYICVKIGDKSHKNHKKSLIWRVEPEIQDLKPVLHTDEKSRKLQNFPFTPSEFFFGNMLFVSCCCFFVCRILKTKYRITMFHDICLWQSDLKKTKILQNNANKTDNRPKFHICMQQGKSLAVNVSASLSSRTCLRVVGMTRSLLLN